MVTAIHDGTPDGIRWLADCYRHIGTAYAALGHSRFEDGSEHFWAYACEHATGVHHVHVELISFAVVAIANVQENDPAIAHRIVSRAGVRAHPDDLGISRAEFVDHLVGLRAYSHAAGLDVGVTDLTDITVDAANHAFDIASMLPLICAQIRSVGCDERTRADAGMASSSWGACLA